MRVAVFGCVARAKPLIDRLAGHVEFIGFIDNNQSLHGKIFLGKPVYSPVEVTRLNLDYIIVAIFQYRSIKRQLIELGFPSENILVFLGCRPPADVTSDNDRILKSMLVSSTSNRICLALSDDDVLNDDLTSFYHNAPEEIKKRFSVTLSKFGIPVDGDIVIHNDLRACPSYLFGRNIALWKNLSFSELANLVELDSNPVGHGAWLHGIEQIIIRGDVDKRFPWLSWDIKNNNIDLVAIPEGQVSIKQYTNNAVSKPATVVFLPSPNYAVINSPDLETSWGYLTEHTEAFGFLANELNKQGMKFKIALPDEIFAKDNCLKNHFGGLLRRTSNVNFLSSDVFIVDGSMSTLSYLLLCQNALYLQMNLKKVERQISYSVGKQPMDNLVETVSDFETVLQTIQRIKDAKDRFVNKRMNAISQIFVDDNREGDRRLWASMV